VKRAELDATTWRAATEIEVEGPDMMLHGEAARSRELKAGTAAVRSLPRRQAAVRLRNDIRLG